MHAGAAPPPCGASPLDDRPPGGRRRVSSRQLFHVEQPRAPKRRRGTDGRETLVVTIAVLSQKGGVGKTVTVTNLGVCLAERGQRVLMVDFDPQADLSASWGLEDDEPHPRVEQYLGVATGDVGAALFEIPRADDGRLALLPTAYEALRSQTARLL